ncbi:MAG: hypothetical protein HY019_03940 [Aquabacterium sp.]|uniref:hypothetical protein n=1 Tax=Aquabacterium sp. TaxID=1872578 RepID=UPI0025C0A9FC|nr:hypothetical protein [Aquabacterium sp.]MBI3381137.1 hypothetical protein [Aquabacterium sp.]
MSTTLVPKSPSKLWLLALAVLAVGVYIWLRHGQAQAEQDQHQKALAPAPNGMWPSAGAAGASEGQGFIPKGPVGETRPTDFSQEDWDALNKALENEPNKARERNRLVAYLRFQRAVSKWSEMKDGPNVVERQGLAHELVQQLPSHVANGEINSGEATLLLTAVAADLEADPAKRQAWVEAQRTQLQGTQSPEQAKALQEEQRKNEDFARQQAEVVARWQKSPVAEQDPATLERQLQALREKVYGGDAR